MARRTPGKSPLTEQFIERLFREYERCQSARRAVNALGYGEGAFHKWRRRGETEMDRRENLAESQGLDHWEQLDWTDPVSVREEIYVKFVKAYWGAASRLRGSLAQTALAGALGSPSVVHRDANGDVIRDPQGYPVLARAEIPPDPRLALNLLARLEPQTWGPAKATDPALWGAEETVDTLEIEYVPERAISDDDRRELENLD